jgi:flagellar basal body L-ring protein FlgH
MQGGSFVAHAKPMMKMKFCISMVIMLVCSVTACVRVPDPGSTNSAVNTGVPTATPQMPAPTTAAPSFTPGVLGAEVTPHSNDADTITKAMQRDIDLLIAQSQEQQGQEENYKSQKKEQTLTVERVSGTELKFKSKPQVFQGDYTGRFTRDRQYHYFEDASMGGKRYYNVKDNFGVWITFQYQDPNFR